MRLEQFATQGHVRNRTQALLVAWVCPSGMIWAKSFPFGFFFFFSTWLHTSEKGLCGITMMHVLMRCCVTGKCSSMLVLWDEHAQFPSATWAYVWVFACWKLSIYCQQMFYNQSAGQPTITQFLCKAGNCCCRPETQNQRSQRDTVQTGVGWFRTCRWWDALEVSRRNKLFGMWWFLAEAVVLCWHTGSCRLNLHRFNLP